MTHTNVMQAFDQITYVKTIGQRLKEIRLERGISQAALAKTAGVATSTIGNLESGLRDKPRELNAIARALGVDPEWLETGKPSTLFEHDRLASAQFLPGFEELSIPVLAQSGSMGLGSEAIASDVVRGRLTVSPQWALQHVKPTDLKNLRFIHGYGDSMDPTFIDGDILLVDVGVKDPKVDGVYVLEANDRIYIKRIRQRIDGIFEISSDNPTVKTVDILNGEHQVEIHGRVVWCWNGKKM